VRGEVMAIVKGSLGGSGSFQAPRWRTISPSISKIFGHFLDSVAGSTRKEQGLLVSMVIASPVAVT
jgi:hypothetical protein